MSTTWTQGANVRDVRAPALMTVRDANNKVVAFCADTDHMHLIAAAPELLEALQTMTKAFLTYAPKTEGAEYNCVIEARAAIAKATGGQS